jgi:anti-anti-sigma factor
MASSQVLHMTVKRGEGRGVRLLLEGELDLLSGPELAHALDVVALDGEDVIVDLSGLDFVDASGLRALLEAAHRTGLRFERGPAHVQRLFEVTGTEREFAFVT